jgi:hypothetical protein
VTPFIYEGTWRRKWGRHGWNGRFVGRRSMGSPLRKSLTKPGFTLDGWRGQSYTFKMSSGY